MITVCTNTCLANFVNPEKIYTISNCNEVKIPDVGHQESFDVLD